MLTGGAGFIGSHVVDALVEAGHPVVVVDNLSTGRREFVHPKATFYQRDILAPALEEVFAGERPEVVIHHAAQVSVQASLREPPRDAEANILGSLKLLELSRRHGVRKFIYISSGGAIYGEPRSLPCDEAHPVSPLSPYGASKHSVEHYLDLYRQLYGLSFTVLRYANVYGPRQDPYGEAGVVAIFAQRLLRGEPPVINGSGEQERDFVYVEDIVAANLLALERGESQAYNLGSGQGTSVNRIFQLLKRLTGYSGEPSFGPPREGEVFKIYLDARKAEAELGWRPRVSLEEGLARTVAYFRSREAV